MLGVKEGEVKPTEGGEQWGGTRRVSQGREGADRADRFKRMLRRVVMGWIRGKSKRKGVRFSVPPRLSYGGGQKREAYKGKQNGKREERERRQ